MSQLDKNQDHVMEDAANERSVLTKRADLLGISYSNNIGLETLRQRIEEKLESANAVEATQTQDDKMSKAKKDATRLVRVNISSMESIKNNLFGEIITVSNNVIGTVKRFFPFGVDWHVESIILDTLRDKEYQAFRNERHKDGSETRKGYLAKAYGIQELPPLTQTELDLLKARQMARNSIEK